MKESIIKMPIASRVSAELRRQLEIEASEKGQNLSVYMEFILTNRHTSTYSENVEAEMSSKFMEESERAEALEAQYVQLIAASKAAQVQRDNERILALKTQLAQSESQYQNLLQRHSSVETERDALANLPKSVLPDWWSLEYYKETIPYMKELRSTHPDYSVEQLILSSVAVAAANEKNSFFVYTLKDFWKRNPHLLNLRTPVAAR